MNPTEQEISDLVKKMCPGGEQHFSKEKLIKLVQERGPDQDSVEDLVNALKVFDTNRDNKLSREEFRTAMMTMGERMQDSEIDEILGDTELLASGQDIDITDFAQKVMNRL